MNYGDPDEYERPMSAEEKYARTPGKWGGATDLSHDVWVRHEPDRQGAEAWGFWHWCTARDDGPRWAYAVPGKHDLIADEPLHLEPSLLWPCCGKHGWVREGRWTEA